MSTELFLDGALLLLLAVLIGYCFVLNRRLKAFIEARAEMTGLVIQLSEATDKSRNAVINLRTAAREEEVRLKQTVGQGKGLVDELQMMIEMGSNLADRIEKRLVPQKKTDIDQDEATGKTSGDDEMRETLRNIR